MKLFLLLSFLVCSAVCAADLQIESISIKDSGQPKEFDKYMGDYIVEIKIRNTSKKPIQIARYSVSNYFRADKPLNPEGKVEYDTDFYKNNSLCCHPPIFDTIGANETFTLRYRDSSRNVGKEMFLKTGGRNGDIEIGKYILKLAKKG